MAARHAVQCPAHVRVIEVARRASTAPDARFTSSRAVAPSTVSGYARYVGRVGALAVALGVGAAVLPVAVAAADTTGSAGSTGSSSDAASSPSASSPSAASPSTFSPSSPVGARSRGRTAPDGPGTADDSAADSAFGVRTGGSAGVAAPPVDSGPSRARHRRAGVVVSAGVDSTGVDSTRVGSHPDVQSQSDDMAGAVVADRVDAVVAVVAGSGSGSSATSPTAPPTAPVMSTAPRPAASGSVHGLGSGVLADRKSVV